MTKIANILRWFFAFLITAHPLYTSAADHHMTMTFIPPNKLLEAAGGPAFWEIYLDGEIDNQTADQFSREVSRRGAEGALVSLNSPGGSLGGGLALGEAIRRYGMSTEVGSNPGTEQAYDRGLPGICASACVFAYLGGVYRWLNDRSKLGVHRYAKADPAEVSPDDMDNAQIASGAIVSYLQQMGVDAELLSIMAETAPARVTWLDKKTSERLNVVNSGRMPPRWTIETVTAGDAAELYLKGEQQTWVGTGKSIFLCGNSKLIFSPMYEGGSNSQNIANSSARYSISIDDHFIPLKSDGTKLIVKNNYVTAMFPISKSMALSLDRARKIGFAAQPPGDGVTYWGFYVDVKTTQDAAKIRGFVRTCLGHTM